MSEFVKQVCRFCLGSHSILETCPALAQQQAMMQQQHHGQLQQGGLYACAPKPEEGPGEKQQVQHVTDVAVFTGAAKKHVDALLARAAKAEAALKVSEEERERLRKGQAPYSIKEHGSKLRGAMLVCGCGSENAIKFKYVSSFDDKDAESTVAVGYAVVAVCETCRTIHVGALCSLRDGYDASQRANRLADQCGCLRADLALANQRVGELTLQLEQARKERRR